MTLSSAACPVARTATVVLTIKRDMNIAEATQFMEEKGIRRLVAVEEKDILAGIITGAKILKAVLRTLQ